MTLSGKKILVIGYGSSIGQKLVDGFAKKGAKTIATVRDLNERHVVIGEEVFLSEMDLLDPSSFDKFCTKTFVSFGELDIVIFLSGILPGKSLHDYDDDLMQKVMSINFTGQAALFRRLLPYLAEGSHVIMMSSISAELGSFDPIYAASKAALIGFVKSLALWLAPRTRFNAIAPALVEDSSMFNLMDSNRQNYHLKNTPTQRLTTKDELVGIILNLCEPAWSNVNGQIIRINGGLYV